MAGAYVNSGSRNATAGATSRSCAVPASLVNGNILIATCCVKNGDDISISGSGWAQFGSQIKIGTSFTAILAWRIVDGGEGSCTFTWTNSAAAQAHMHQFSGTAPSPIGAINSNSGSTSTHGCTGITTTRDDSFVIYIDMAAANTALATPSGWTEDQDGGSATSVSRDANGSKTVATSGSASGDISVTGASADWVMYQVELLMPSGTASITQASDTIVATATIASGGGRTGSVSLTQASDTVSAAGTLALKGTAAITQAGDTVAATGTIGTTGAITLVGTPQVGSTTNGGDVTLTFSTTPLENDIVIVYGGAPLVNGSNPTAPGTGYTQIGLHSSASLWFGAWIKRMGASPDSSVVCHGNGSVSSATAYGCYVLRGVDTTTAQDATATTAGVTTSTNPDCPSITTVTNNAWVLAVAGSKVYDTTPGTISGYLNQYNTAGDDTNDITVAGATFEKTTAGAEDPAAWSSWASGNWYAITIALRPAAASSGWTNISKINGVTATSVAKVNGIDVANISKVNGVSV